MIRQIIGRCHVGETNREVCAYLVSRIKKSVWRKLPLGKRVSILREAIKCHAENRALYCQVMRGNFS